MQCQALDKEEILSIRWAHDDPNPVAKDAIERANKDALTALFRARGICLETGTGFDYPADYTVPTDVTDGSSGTAVQLLTGGEEEEEDNEGEDGAQKSKKTKLNEYSAHGVVAYPNTDIQYISGFDTTSTASGAASGSEGVSSSSWVQAPAQIPDATAQIPDAASAAEGGEWIACTDPDSGAVYYYHSITNEVSWGSQE
jgi:hypothetical protein